MSSRSARLRVLTLAAETAAKGLEADFAQRGHLRISEKAPSDFVSSADLRSQETIRDALSRTFPGYALVMEEGDAGAPVASQGGRIIVDPLDGTMNFLRGIPHFAIAIAIEEAGIVTAGVVLDVPKHELFAAERGHGAWLGEAPLAAAHQAVPLAHAVIATGIPHRGREGHEAYVAALSRVMPEVAGVRRLGAAALDLAYVAAGRFDAFFEWGLAPWDVAAGMLLVTETGGVVTKSDGTPTTVAARDVLASSTASMHARCVELLRARAPQTVIGIR